MSPPWDSPVIRAAHAASPQPTTAICSMAGMSMTTSAVSFMVRISLLVCWVVETVAVGISA
eukprot:7798933-Pyramimonas_sp.AAC.1